MTLTQIAWGFERCRRCGHRNRAHRVVNGLYLLCPQRPVTQQDREFFATASVVSALLVVVLVLLLLAGPNWAWVP